MKAAILFEDLSGERYTQERSHIVETSNTLEDHQVSIARAPVVPAVTTRWHRLVGITERYYILSGNGQMEIDDSPAQTVHPGNVVRIPPACRQRITNMGADDLIFLAICSPRFTSAAYEDLEPAGMSKVNGWDSKQSV
ncbi:MAG: cupin domain-containing protein [Nitrosospira sp.]|nr:cupin domain-containing protein [Nitrosospira sp.]